MPVRSESRSPGAREPRKLPRVLLTTAFLLAPPAIADDLARAPGKMEVVLDAAGATAKGVTPGGAVTWIGASRSRADWSDHVAKWRQTGAEGDRDGAVAFERKGGFPRETVLAAVDLTTGAFAVGATWPIDAETPAPVFAGAKSDAAGLLNAFAQRGRKVDILVVRPGAGAFAARVLDGGPLDADAREDGTVTVSFASLPARAGKAERLDGLRPGDVVVLVDTEGPSLRAGRYTGNPGEGVRP